MTPCDVFPRHASAEGSPLFVLDGVPRKTPRLTPRGDTEVLHQNTFKRAQNTLSRFSKFFIILLNYMAKDLLSKPSEVDPKSILQKFAWDRVVSEEELLIRALLYADPIELLKAFSKEKLKEVFLNNLHRFDKKNLNFWKIILEIDEDEFNRYAEKNFRLVNKIFSD
jgi:hypothetical protein